jgi:trimethylamine--corrinoid protein Co-methyltransferase
VDAYSDVEPGGHFLGSAHTLASYTTAFYEAKLSDSNSVEQWDEQGSKDAATRAYERWNQLLDEYEAPPLDPARREALEDYVARRKSALPDAWY